MMMQDLAQQIAHHLIHPAYTHQSRHSESIIQAPYRHILDPYFDSQYAHSTYPLNSVGALTRLPSECVELFVNIPQLYRLFRAVCVDLLLTKAIDDVESQGGMSAVRDLFVEVLRIVGQHDYDVEGAVETSGRMSLRIHFTCPYLRIGVCADGQRIFKIYRAPLLGEERFANKLFIVETSGRTSLPENILREQFEGREFTFVTDISKNEALEYATSCASVIPSQLGYRAQAKTTDGAVSAEQVAALCDESREFILARMQSQGGYCFVDYLSWLMEHSEFKKCLFSEAERLQKSLI